MSELSMSLIVKLASLVVHIQEGTEDGRHEFDLFAACALANDAEVTEWLAGVDPVLLPSKRLPAPREEGKQ